jgi:hypothetical protein
MGIDERLQALTMNLELLHRDVIDLKAVVAQDAENIRALARIAETHHERLAYRRGGPA